MNALKIVVLMLLLGPLGALASEGDTLKQTNGVLHFFLDGSLHGNIRNFTMSTINSGSLSDYYANAMGASIHYETATWKGLKFGLNGMFIYKMFSNDLNRVDAMTGKVSSYERQLFDLEHPNNYDNLDRLEELYVQYERRHTRITLGKMEIETPMVNIHDGRMKPKVFSGIMGEQGIKNIHVHASWFVQASPRSTTHWYKIQDAIGIYNNGCLDDGSEATYHHHLTSAGLGIFGAEWHKKHHTLEAWNYVLDNISNTSIGRYDYEQDSSWQFGIMYMHQFPFNNGGSDSQEHTFHQNWERTHAVSAKVGYELPWFDLSVASTVISNQGRYLFPREFGVDPFYTFISRSQLEGFGDTQAYDVKISKDYKNWTLGFDWNRVIASSDLRQNKYNLPSYDQFNIDVNYDFGKKLEGLHARMLYVYRGAVEEQLSALQQFNKANFHQFNLIFNFHF
jgi:hypothetical protein